MAFTDATNTGIEYSADVLTAISTVNEVFFENQLFIVNAWKEQWYGGVEFNDTYLYATKVIYETGSAIAADGNFPEHQIWPAGVPT